MVLSSSLKKINTNRERNLYDLSMEKPVFLVFLRHFGCIFCQKALLDLAERKARLKEKNMQMVLVHMAEDDIANKYFEKYGVSNAEAISDPECQVYQEFGLTKGNFKQLFGLRNWVTGFERFVTSNAKGSLKQIGDGFQMPGVFVVYKGEIKAQYIHEISSSQPDYDMMMECCDD